MGGGFLEAVRIFLGANSSGGFYPLYDQLLGGRFDDLIILKGGPGSGKSTFMRTAWAELAAAGWTGIEVNCSGDPASLDGVLFAAQRVGFVDGTPPHTLEPTYAAAHERTVDLSRFCNGSAAKAARAEIVAHADAYRAAYADAYRALRAAGLLAAERCAVVRAAAPERIGQRVEAAARRECGGTAARRGRVDRAFLGGLTHLGELCRFDTADALCPRVYELADSWGLAARALETACELAAGAGCDVLACPDPDRPQELRHVLIPARGVAFVTSTARTPYPGKPYRRLRLDAAAWSALPRTERGRLRLTGRVERLLREQAEAALRRAKREHDALEAAYRPFIDFDGVRALAKEEARRILNAR